MDELEVTEGGGNEGDGDLKGGASDTDPNDGKNHQEDRKAMWATLKNMIGADVMSVFSVPVFIMEPMSTLQKMAEILQYQHLLDEAADVFTQALASDEGKEGTQAFLQKRKPSWCV